MRRTQNELIRIRFVALGCPKNLVDSEKMLGVLAEEGMLPVSADTEADAVIINTCGFIAPARQEALEAIREAVEAKQRGEVRRVIVAGCLAQLWGEKLYQHAPGIDAVVGLGGREKMAQVVRGVLSGKRKAGVVTAAGRFEGKMRSDQARLRLTEPWWGYLRISEGCDRGCTFCTIPKIRGPFRSKSVEMVLSEARELAADGVVEINLIGQETTGYGRDIGYERGLAGLLRELNDMPDVRWIRVLYAHPATLTEEIIDAMGGCERVVPYLDIPLQHINNRILTLMRRRVTRKRTEELLKKLKRRIDNLTIRTTMLVGFPSETNEEFEELVEFVRRERFEALGVFGYSAEEGTAASRMPGAVPEEVKKERADRLMQVQQPIAFEAADRLAGRETECLIGLELERAAVKNLGLAAGKRWYAARHAGQAAEIDSECYVSAEKGRRVKPGQIAAVRMESRRDYDLIGTLA